MLESSEDYVELLGSSSYGENHEKIVIPLRWCNQVLLPFETGKPFPELTDVFWSEFCEQVRNIYDRKSILCPKVSRATVELCMVLSVALSLCSTQPYLALYLSIGICYYTFFYPIVADASLGALLHTIEVYCKGNLNGFKLSYNRKYLGLKGYLTIERISESELSLSKDDAIEDELVPEENEIRVLLGKWHCPSFPKRAHDYFLLEDQHPPPPGVSESAWKILVRDLCQDIELRDAHCYKLITGVILAYVITLYQLGVINPVCLVILIPLGSICIGSRIGLRHFMTWKFGMIDKFGNTLVGPTYHVSYHAVRWYSRCDDYILFQRCGRLSNEI